MKISLLVVEKNERFSAEATEAARIVFPGVSVSEVSSIADARAAQEGPQPEVLILSGTNEATAKEATGAVDGHKLPRWAVVALGEFGPVPFAEVVPEAEWNAAVVSRSLRSAVALHLLRRDRERLRGDILTIGTRIAHDLRTPVGGIVSSTEVLEAVVPGEGATGKELTQPILESTNELARIIALTTLVTRATARAAAPQAFDMGMVVGRALDRVEMRVRERQARVAKPASWPEVRGDPAHVEAVWVCLIDNALRHSGASPQVAVGWEPKGDGTQFWVSDGGRGIAPEKQRSLFHPFHLLHEPNAPRGLGLAIIERLVHLQGGLCGFEPVSPTGSRFYFWLPR